MKNRTKFKTAILFSVIFVFFGCSNPRQNESAEIVGIDNFEISKTNSEVILKPNIKQLRVTIKDTLNLAELGIPITELGEYQIYLYVYELGSPDHLFRQNPIMASTEWSVNANLGGDGDYRAQVGQIFKVTGIISKKAPKEVISSLSDLSPDLGFKRLPRTLTMEVVEAEK